WTAPPASRPTSVSGTAARARSRRTFGPPSPVDRYTTAGRTFMRHRSRTSSATSARSSSSTWRSIGCATRAPVTELDALVAGDAAITFAWQVSTPPSPGRTSKLLGAVEPEGRFGGCAPGVALALAELGHRVALVSWL